MGGWEEDAALEEHQDREEHTDLEEHQGDMKEQQDLEGEHGVAAAPRRKCGATRATFQF